MTMYDFAQYKGGEPGVASLAIGGPLQASNGRRADTASRRKVFVCRPTGLADEEPCARKILSTLARRAYRRPVTDEDIQTLLAFYRTGRRDGGFEAGIGLALERMLAGPEFLFRIERDPDDRRCLARRIASATSSLRRGCRSSSGAASRTTSCWIWPSAAG